MPAKSSKPIRYPWEVWFDQPRVVLKRGQHYKCQPHAMAQQVRNAAHKRGVKICHIDIKDAVVTVTLEFSPD